MVEELNISMVAIFNYEGKKIRSFVDENRETWLSAADVCAVLEITNVSNAMSRLDDDEKDSRVTLTAGGNQRIGIINESGLYKLIFRSDKPEAESFRKWVFSEILPTIRKTGGYGVQKSLSPIEMLEQQLAIMKSHEAHLADHDNRIERLESVVDTQGTQYFTIKAYCSYKKYHGVSQETANRLGRSASKLSRAKNYEIGEAPDQVYGHVHSYHVDILTEVIDPEFSSK